MGTVLSGGASTSGTHEKLINYINLVGLVVSIIFYVHPYLGK